jgi:hypothetical protein
MVSLVLLLLLLLLLIPPTSIFATIAQEEGNIYHEEHEALEVGAKKGD